MSTQEAHAVVMDVAKKTGVSFDNIVSERRYPSYVRARRMVAAELRRRGYSLHRIGCYMQRHHTTILHMLRVEGVCA